MESLHTAWLRLKAILQRRRLDRDLDEEVAFHLAMREQKRRADGMSEPDARSASLRQFGNVTLMKENTRTLWTFVTLESWYQDIRYALRNLAHKPALVVVVMVSLALGIGANTAIFSVLNAALLKELPVPDPQRLMLLTWSEKQWPGRLIEDIEGGGKRDQNGVTGYSFSSDVYQYLHDHKQSFDSLVAFAANSEQSNVGLGGHAQVALVVGVSGDFFQGLRVSPIVGRSLLPSDDQDSAPPACMVSYRFWQSHMGGDPAIAGKTIVVNGTPTAVVGVAPPEFFGVQPGEAPDIWIPLSSYAATALQSGNYDLRAPKVWWLGVIGRLKPGVTETAARAETRVLFDQSLNIGSAAVPRDDKVPTVDLTPVSRGLDSLRRQFSTSLWLLMAMVGLVLLIACANVAGLLLARASGRQREISVRISLGAPRQRIIRQLLTESVLLGMAGGAAGLLLARWTSKALMALFGSGREPVTLAVSPDARVLGFTFAVSVLSGIVFGMAPALRATRVDVYSTLKQTASQASQGRRKFLSGKILVGAQVALSLLLLVSAGLLLRTLGRLQTVNLGFERRNLVTFRVQPGLNNYKGQPLAEYYQELRQRLQAVPGVSSVGFSQLGLVNQERSSTDLMIPGYTQGDTRVPMYRHWIGTGYFETLGIPVILGRALTQQDVTGTTPVAVVNERVVREYFHGDNPVGHQLELGGTKRSDRRTIVGVVRDAKYYSLREDPPPTMYLSYLQPYRAGQYATFLTFFVRTAGEPRAMMPVIQSTALSLDRNVPLYELRTETEVIDRALFLERTFAILSSAFGFLALLLACVGLYGTIGYTVAQRTNEIGIRMALGAESRAILKMVLRETLVIVTAGLVVGLPLAFLGTRLLKARLFGLSPHDPGTIALAVSVIVAVTLAAGFLPARRAARVDPMVALRYE